MKELTVRALRSRLRTRVVGREIHCLDRVKSTNEVAWQRALEGAENGTCIFAEEQTAGRGRYGRTWISSRGQGIFLSVLLRQPLPLERVPLVTAIGAMAAVEAIDETTGLAAKIRFPNDVMLGERKVAGVLVESRFVASVPDLFILGIGLNVGQEDFPGELAEIATSLRIEKGDEVSRVAVARALLESLDRWVRELDGSLSAFRKFWHDHSAILGRRVRVKEGGKSYTGTVAEVDPLDGLAVRLSHGQVRGFRGEHVEHLEVLPVS